MAKKDNKQQERRKITIAVFLCLAAFISLFYGIFTPSPSKRILKTGVSESIILNNDKLEMPPAQTVSFIRSAKKSSFTAWGRNPFMLRPDKQRPPAVKLMGIIWDKEPKAVLNGNLLGIGETINKVTIIDIKEDSVILNDGLKDFELYIEGAEAPEEP
ncbi:MAG: hypothetical protein ABH872_01675 [Candidatus Omnitrophota bacterium]